MRRSPSGAGVLGVRGALWARRHPRSLHQYLQICELDSGGHEEQLTGVFASAPWLGGSFDPQSSNTPSVTIPSSHSSWPGDLLPRAPTPASPSKIHGFGRRERLTIWNKHNITRGGVTSVYSVFPCWLRREGRPIISCSTHRRRNSHQRG